MDPNKRNELITQQRGTIGLISRCLENMAKLGKPQITAPVITSRKNILQNYWEKCQIQHAVLEAGCNPAAREEIEYFTNDEFGLAEATYMNHADQLSELLHTHAGTHVAYADINPPQQTSFIKLPPIEIPTFSGNYAEWESFRDLFTSVIANNTTLSDVQKLQYLKTRLTGEANLLLKNTAVTSANYATAWETLNSRYENSRVIITAHLRNLFSIRNIGQDTLKDLKNMRDQANDVTTSLKNLKRPVDKWEDMLVYHLVSKMDSDSLREWETSLSNSTEYPTYDDLQKFFTVRIRTLEAIAAASGTKNKTNSAKRNEVSSHLTAETQCSVCDANHFLHQCEEFKGKALAQRKEIARESRCCINCLRPGHLPRECSSKNVCRHCKAKHHTLIHEDKKPGEAENSRKGKGSGQPPQAKAADPRGSSLTKPQESNAPRTPEGSKQIPPSSGVPGNHVTSHVSADAPKKGSAVILATAWVRLKSTNGRSLAVRALLDQGSQSSFVAEGVVHLLRASSQRVSASVTGIGGNYAGNIKRAAHLTVEPCRAGGPVVSVNAFVLPKLTNYRPTQLVNWEHWEHLRDLDLADSSANHHAPIELLIGADVYGSILLQGLRQGPTGPIAQRTIFGWVVSGPTTSDAATSFSLNVMHCHDQDNLERSLRRFWEIEELPRNKFLTVDEQRCEQHFTATHSRAPDGKYIVRLPFKTNLPLKIGQSKAIASAAFTSLERRFKQKPEQATQYRDFLTEYEELGHMRVVSSSEPQPRQAVYFPHHPVMRDSSTTKLRVVFNASSPTSNGTSLNDLLLTGPKLQIDLTSIILRWRSFRYVYTADMAKMFRQIWVDSQDTEYQRILWRNESSEPLKSYRLQTVTYGTACAPYLSLKVIQQLARDEGEHYPLASSILGKNIYVDDVLFGADDIILAKQTQLQLSQLLTAGGFHLRKWTSNCQELLRDIPEDDREKTSGHPFEDGDGVKILGIQWAPVSDEFRFRISAPECANPTKRQVLSTIARIFDPLGWAAPVVIPAKAMLQTVWGLECGWDDNLPRETREKWQQYCAQLVSLENVSIPRWTGQAASVTSLEIHGFADASNTAYAAAVYLRVSAIPGTTRVNLLLAKSKVAPIKSLSIPRLELSAAALLARVIETVRETMELTQVPVYCWSDSTNTLYWISQHPSRWNTFVANRVSDIQQRLPTAQWRHVPTKQNPADCASRGISASEFLNHPLWWHGPDWLRKPAHDWPPELIPNKASSDLEAKMNSHVIQAEAFLEWDDVQLYSSWPRLLRVTAYVLRFVNRARRQLLDGQDLALTLTEIENAKILWIKHIQNQMFEKEIRDLSRDQDVSTSSSLRALSPFLDNSGVIRVGGRLRHANLSLESKHPIVLPKHRVAELIIAQTHQRALHGGVQVTLRILRQQYWILSARNLVKSLINKCVTCVRQRALRVEQFMGELPRVRVMQSQPFSHSGVDYAGPLQVRIASGRGHKSHKAYIAVFVCLATRATHLELVSDYSSAAFLAAFDRFSSRRGIPCAMYSDNGTTFQGADKELTTAFRATIRDPENRTRLASDGTAWHFLPPVAPHFGGIWESGVKSVKHHIRRVIGAHTPTFEELTTLLCQIEAVLNSRPIAPLTDDLDSFDALTPGHFLVGAPLKAVPSPSLLEINENRLSRWQLVRRLFEQFWRIWSTDYLNSIQQRHKWSAKRSNLKIGDLVLLRSENLPPAKWELGRVVDCHPGTDGLIRVITVKTATSTFKRPITQLCRLPIESGQ